MKVLFSCIISIVICNHCFADIPDWQKVLHKKKADSLQIVLEHTNESIARIDLLTEISKWLIIISTTESYKYAAQANSLANKINYDKGLCESFTWIAIIAEKENRHKISVYYWEQAMLVAERMGDRKTLVRLHVSVLNSCFFLGDYIKIMDICMKGIPLAKETNDLDAEVHFLNSLGAVFIKQREFEKARKCYFKSLELAKEIGDTSLMGKSYNNLGKAYSLQGKQLAAIENYTKSINLLENTSCIGDYASALNGLAKAYLLDNNYSMALKYALACEDFVKVRGGQNPFDLADYHLTLGEIYTELRMYALATDYLEKGLNIAISINHKEHSKRGFEILSRVYAARGKYKKAFEYHQMFSILKDSLVNLEATERLATLEAKSEIDKKDYEIGILNKENEVNNSKHSRMNFIRNMGVGIFILTVSVLFLLYNRSQLKQKNKLLGEISKQQNDMFNKVISLQDKERKRIAEDLHDGLGSTLSTIKLNLERLSDEELNFNEAQIEQYATALSLSNEALSDLRNIAHNLMPPTLSKLGLVAALQNLFDRISQYSGINIHFSTHDFETRLESNMEMSIFRIMLEIMNNIVTHAKATEIVVQFVKFEHNMNITVEDNGIGFNPEKVRSTKGIGLKNIASRIEFMKGTYTIDTSEGHGTTYVIDIPIIQKS